MIDSETNEIKKDLNTLIESKYALSPKQFAKEELAVKQTIQRLLHVLDQPEDQLNLLASISVKSIETMTQFGQLTLIAENLDDDFLRSIGRVLEKSTVEFNYDGSKIGLSTLYSTCRDKLKKVKEPNVGDVLLRMYTEETPFYNKLNAILGQYNDSKTTTVEEKKLALLLNVAIHKAGLDKRRFEVQQMPDKLYRGQKHRLADFVKKYEKVKELHAQGKLASLSPVDLAEINIVEIVGKKIVSTTVSEQVAANFSNGEGLILHIENPQELADFYTVTNISAVPSEAEYITRMPDDVVMIPIFISPSDRFGDRHIHVVCIRSENLLLNNSTRMNDIRESLKDCIQKVIDNSSGFFSFMSSDALHNDQKTLMEELIMIINESEKIEMQDSDDQNKFLQKAFLTLGKLYTGCPTPNQKQIFDNINTQLQEYAAVVADLRVTHKNYNPADIVEQETNKLQLNLDRKYEWLLSVNKMSVIIPIRNDLNQLLNSQSSLVDKREAAKNILKLMEQHSNIETKFPTLKSGIEDMIVSIDTIEKYKEFTQNSPIQEVPSQKYKVAVEKLKDDGVENKQDNAHEGGDYSQPFIV